MKIEMEAYEIDNLISALCREAFHNDLLLKTETDKSEIELMKYNKLMDLELIEKLKPFASDGMRASLDWKPLF